MTQNKFRKDLEGALKVFSHSKEASTVDFRGLSKCRGLSSAKKILPFLDLAKVESGQDLVEFLGLVVSSDKEKHLKSVLERCLSSEAILLLKNPKVSSAQKLGPALKACNGYPNLIRLLPFLSSAEIVGEIVDNAGGHAAIGDLERVLHRVGDQMSAELLDLTTYAGKSAQVFSVLAQHAMDLVRQPPSVPNVAPPPQVAQYGFVGADMVHFMDHTFEHVLTTNRANAKQGTSFFPVGTGGAGVARALGEALDDLLQQGQGVKGPGQPRGALINGLLTSNGNSNVEATTSSGTCVLGARQQNGGGYLGQFYPKNTNHISQKALQSLGRLLCY